MAKTQPHSAPERYEDIVRRLNEVVQLLESSDVPCKACAGTGSIEGRSCTACGGQGREALPLEESLKAFEEGISLVRRGAANLGEAAPQRWRRPPPTVRPRTNASGRHTGGVWG